MKVLLVNGSPHKAGCVFTALSEMAAALEKHGIETEIFQLGTAPVRGCTACGYCYRAGKCAFDDDCCNTLAQKMLDADGIVLGSPVYYAAPNGALCAVLDRAFYTVGKRLAGKPGAAVVSCRRGGASAAFDRLNKYFTINQMPIVSSTYWNSIHGNNAEEARQDLEGLQTMRTLGENMARLLKAAEGAPEKLTGTVKKEMTNFIR